jgi:hypothetical protein
MSIEGQKFYPGEEATPRELLTLAEAYRQGAESLFSIGGQKSSLSRLPYRFIAIHAIELYLNAFLQAQGHLPKEIRGLQHNLAARTDRALKAGLKLRARTAEHLRTLTKDQEYLVARYSAKQVSPVSPLNRLEATLREVAKKVEAIVGAK